MTSIDPAIIEKAAEAKFRRAFPNATTHPWEGAAEADYCRAAVARAIAPVVGDIRAEALRDAANALNSEGLSLKPGGWGSNPADQQTSRFALAILGWLRDRADELDGGQS